MNAHNFVGLDDAAFNQTRDAIHAYARVLGNWLKQCRDRRKHWWHASLRPSLTGLTTGVIHATVDFELELNLRESLLLARTATGEPLMVLIQGQPAAQILGGIQSYLTQNGVERRYIVDADESDSFHTSHAGYSSAQAAMLAEVLSSVAGAMESFRAGIGEETSPIQLWPHHFDLSMIWLPGEKIPGQDPEDEEYSDKQMNFGFAFGDEGIPEPYFYVTAYPLPDALPATTLPTGSHWQSDGFNGAVLLYKTVTENDDPRAYLLDLWNRLLSAGRQHMLQAK